MTTEKSKNRERSAAYPGFALGEIIQATSTLRAQLGSVPCSREAAAQALGYAGISGISATKIAACVHFGLLVRIGNTYKQSELADRILNNTSEDELKEAKVESFKKPVLYSKLINSFNGQALPVMIENILVRNYNIKDRVAKDVAKNFRKSAEYAGVLTNGILSIENVMTENKEKIQDQIPNPADHSEKYSQTKIKNTKEYAADCMTVEIPGTEVAIIFPSSLAYNSIKGDFKESFEKLEENIKAVREANEKVNEKVKEANDNK